MPSASPTRWASPRTRATGRPASLVFTRSPADAELVGQRHEGHVQVVAVRVPPARVVLDDADAGRADGHVGLPGPPGPAEGVGDDHADVDPGALAEPGAQPGGAGVRVDGQQQHLARLDVGVVDAGRGEDQAVAVPDDAGGPAPGEGVRRGRTDRGLPLGGGDGTPFALADDLRGDDEDVAVAQRAGRVVRDGGEHEGHQVVPGPDLADAAEPHHLQGGPAGELLRHAVTAATALRTNLAVASGVLISRSSVRATSPSSASPAADAASPVSRTQASSTPSRVRAP